MGEFPLLLKQPSFQAILQLQIHQKKDPLLCTDCVPGQKRTQIMSFLN
jgi:hypothetical protein